MSMKFCDHLSPATNNFSPFSLNLLYNKHIRVFCTKLTTHASSLANTRTLEMVDMQLAWLILRALYYYYKKQYEENEDKSILEEYIFCIFKVVTVGYNVIQGSDKGRATNKLNDIYRSVSIEAAETAKTLCRARNSLPVFLKNVRKICWEHYTQSRAISAKFRFPRCWTPTSTG